MPMALKNGVKLGQKSTFYSIQILNLNYSKFIKFAQIPKIKISMQLSTAILPIFLISTIFFASLILAGKTGESSAESDVGNCEKIPPKFFEKISAKLEEMQQNLEKEQKNVANKMAKETNKYEKELKDLMQESVSEFVEIFKKVEEEIGTPMDIDFPQFQKLSCQNVYANEFAEFKNRFWSVKGAKNNDNVQQQHQQQMQEAIKILKELKPKLQVN